MRVLLLQPRSKALGFGEMIRAEPLGLEMVAGGLEPRHEVLLCDLRVQGEGELRRALRDFNPHVCGISCSWSVDHSATLELARAIKALRAATFIAVGGVHATLSPEGFPPPVDAVVIGEGEDTFAELVEALEGRRPLEEIPGLALNDGGGRHLTHPRPLLEDLDSLPFPKRLRFKRGAGYYMGFQRPLALVETSRGCPYRCSFCAVWQFYRGSYRAKSPERVVEELERIEDPFVLFVDDNFLADPQRAEEIALLIRKRGIRRRYTFQARSDSIVRYPELLRLWREVGLKGVFIGFEGVTDEDLRALRKGSSVTDNDRALFFLKGLDIDVWASFIVEPDFTREDFRRLKEYVRSRGVKTPSFSVLTPLPGTKLYEERKGELTTSDYDLFDIAHAVLPTRLPLGQFYEEFCGLYRAAYSSWELIMEGIGAWIKGFPLLDLLKMLRSAKRLSDPAYYLEGHRRSHPSFGGTVTPQGSGESFTWPQGRSAPRPGRAS